MPIQEISCYLKTSKGDKQKIPNAQLKFFREEFAQVIYIIFFRTTKLFSNFDSKKNNFVFFSLKRVIHKETVLVFHVNMVPMSVLEIKFIHAVYAKLRHKRLKSNSSHAKWAMDLKAVIW